MPTLCLDGPTENLDGPTPARKAHTRKILANASGISNTCELPWHLRGDTVGLLFEKSQPWRYR
jgi:hypothetical protein